MRISEETMRLLRMLGDLEALRLGVYGAYMFHSDKKGGKIWPLVFEYQHPLPRPRPEDLELNGSDY